MDNLNFELETNKDKELKEQETVKTEKTEKPKAKKSR